MSLPPLPDLNALSLPDLYAELSRSGLVRRLLELARDEDLGPAATHGDITSVVCPSHTPRIQASLSAREPCVVAGLAALPQLLETFAPSCTVSLRSQDGNTVKAGATLAVIEGPAHQVLRLERSMLNLISRLCGVASNTAAFVNLIRDKAPKARARILDTRKTTPGLRVLEKYAVRCGGGLCHRIGLHDAVLIKDNHLAHVPAKSLADFVEAAADHARSLRPLRFVEVEVDSLEQLKRLLGIRPGLIDFILLDNMPPSLLKDAVNLRDQSRSPVLLEASGGITLDSIVEVALSGVDRISIGSLTRGARSVDLGLDVT